MNGTAVIDAVTHERIDVLAHRKSETLETCLRNNPDVEVVVRDGSATYAEATRRARPSLGRGPTMYSQLSGPKKPNTSNAVHS